MTEERKKLVDESVAKYVLPLIHNKKFHEDLAYMYVRWQDEHEYESWNKYEEVLKRYVPNDCVFVRSTKRPLGFIFSVSAIERSFHVYAKIYCGYLNVIVKLVK